MSTVNKIVVFIKPNFLDFSKEIISIFEILGLRPSVFQIKFNKEILEELYSEYKGQWYYEKLIQYYYDKYILVIFLEGSNAFQQAFEVVGNKDPQKACKGSIRNLFSKDSLQKANSEKRIIDNVIHFQNDKKKMEEEVRIFENFTKNLFFVSL